MGNDASSEALTEKRYGYRVLGVQAQSPASKIGLVSFFDFIVEADGVPLYCKEVSFFIELIRSFADRELPLLVYNCKKHSMREVVLTPTANWPGDGYLGVAIRFDSYHDAEEHLCRVLEVEPDSPAELAGLEPFTDYLLGTADLVFSDSDVLYEELSLHIDRTCEFYVYSSITDEVRVVVLMPSSQWGGDGILGASIAHGYLHGLPTECCSTIGSSSEVSLRPTLQMELAQAQAQQEEDGVVEAKAGEEAQAHPVGEVK